jgi:hypothetical protein
MRLPQLQGIGHDFQPMIQQAARTGVVMALGRGELLYPFGIALDRREVQGGELRTGNGVRCQMCSSSLWRYGVASSSSADCGRISPGASSITGAGATAGGGACLRWNSENMQAPDDGSAGAPFALFEDSHFPLETLPLPFPFRPAFYPHFPLLAIGKGAKPTKKTCMTFWGCRARFRRLSQS